MSKSENKARAALIASEKKAIRDRLARSEKAVVRALANGAEKTIEVPFAALGTHNEDVSLRGAVAKYLLSFEPGEHAYEDIAKALVNPRTGEPATVGQVKACVGHLVRRTGHRAAVVGYVVSRVPGGYVRLDRYSRPRAAAKPGKAGKPDKAAAPAPVDMPATDLAE